MKEDDEDEEGEDLEGQAGEEDVISRSWIFPRAFSATDESCACDLDDCGNDVTGYEES